MTVAEFVKKHLERNQHIEKSIVQSMKDHDFEKANYLDGVQRAGVNLILADKNISKQFKDCIKKE